MDRREELIFCKITERKRKTKFSSVHVEMSHKRLLKLNLLSMSRLGSIVTQCSLSVY